MILGDLPGYRQPQSQALGRPGFFRAVETLEDVWDLVLGYPDSGVGNLYPYAPSSSAIPMVTRPPSGEYFRRCPWRIEIACRRRSLSKTALTPC